MSVPSPISTSPPPSPLFATDREVVQPAGNTKELVWDLELFRRKHVQFHYFIDTVISTHQAGDASMMQFFGALNGFKRAVMLGFGAARSREGGVGRYPGTGPALGGPDNIYLTDAQLEEHMAMEAMRREFGGVSTFSV